jgi:hypothetical protein
MQEITDKVLAADAYLFDVKPKVKWIVRRQGVTASTNFDGESEPNGVMINYYLKSPVQGDVQVKVMKGTYVIAETKGSNVAGINKVLWNMRWTPMSFVPAAAPGRRGMGGGFGQPQTPPPYPVFGGTTAAEVGEYTIVVTAGGKTLTKKTQILEDVWFDKEF